MQLLASQTDLSLLLLLQLTNPRLDSEHQEKSHRSITEHQAQVYDWHRAAWGHPAGPQGQVSAQQGLHTHQKGQACCRKNSSDELPSTLQEQTASDTSPK